MKMRASERGGHGLKETEKLPDPLVSLLGLCSKNNCEKYAFVGKKSHKYWRKACQDKEASLISRPSVAAAAATLPKVLDLYL